MFDWVWELLYLITKTLFKIIDGLVGCANYLCGITPVKVDGQEVDFMQYLLTSNQIGFAFRVSALLGIIVVVIFSIIAIIRTLIKEKAEGTPPQIVGKAIKSILSFLFIPFIMIVIINAGNVFMNAMYRATLQGANSLGDFLFKAFAMESGVAEADVDIFLADPNMDWRVTDHVWSLMDLGEFEFIFSYIAGFVVLGSLGVSMMYFVTRVLHIAILYIVAPFSIGVSILDEGARFKLWREQILIKFITGYGMMIAINVYAMVCLVVMNPSLVFFEKHSFMDYLMKLLLIAGGGVGIKQAMALIGNLISNGAGSNELRDTAISGGLGGLLQKTPGMALANAIGNSLKQEMAGKAAQKILPASMQRSYGNGRGGGDNNNNNRGDGKEGSDNQNSNKPLASAHNAVKDAIESGGRMEGKNGGNGGGSSSANNQKSANERGNQLVNDIINNVGQDNQKGGFDDVFKG